MLKKALKRYSVCKECPNYKKYRCKVCGCFMPIKVLLPGTHCPLVKWF